MKTVFKTTNSAPPKKKNNRENNRKKTLKKIKHPSEVNKRLQKASASKEKSLSQNLNNLEMGKRLQ